MSMLKRFEVNGATYIAHCDTVSTRSGFAHVVKLYKNDYPIMNNRVNYLNRTWECYQYQTAIMGCFYELKNQLLDRLKRDFMDSKEYKKMTPKRREEFELYIADNELLNEYAMALEELRHY